MIIHSSVNIVEHEESYQTVDNECLVMINSTLTMDKRMIIISGLLMNGYFKL